MKLESKIGHIQNTDERAFAFLSDFNNFKHLIPMDKVENWESTEDWCRFTVKPIGNTGIKIIERVPHSQIKLTNLEESNFKFNFWVQLKPAEGNTCYLKLTLDVQLNPMLEMMAKKPLQEFLDKLLEQLSRYPY